MPSMLSIGLCLTCLLSAAVPCWSQSSEPQAGVSSVDGAQAKEEAVNRPDYQLDRAEEDWSSLCKRPMRGADPWDRVKCITLGRSFYVSFGGEVRGSYERYNNY